MLVSQPGGRERYSKRAIDKTAGPWVGFMVTEVDMDRKIQWSTGRPGPMTEYRSVI